MPDKASRGRPGYCVDDTKYQIASAIKTTTGIRLFGSIRLLKKPGTFFTSFAFTLLTGSAVRLMVILFDIVILSFSVAMGS